MAFNSNKTKLIVSTLKEGQKSGGDQEFYIFELEHVKRTLHDFEGSIKKVNKNNAADSEVIHMIHSGEVTSLSSFEFASK